MSSTLALPLFLTLAQGTPDTPELPSNLDTSEVRALVVQHDGRWMPLDTAARDFVSSVTGEERFRDADPVLVLLAWTIDPETWKYAPLITIDNEELRAEIQLSESQTVFSYQDLVSHKRLHALTDALERIPEGRKPNPLESKVRGINDRLLSLQEAFLGQAIALVPEPRDNLGAWHSVASLVQVDYGPTASLREAWGSLVEAFRADDGEAFELASQQLVAAQEKLPAAFWPPAERIDSELHYNDLRPFRTAWIIMAIGALIGGAGMLVRRRWFDLLTLVAVVAGFGMLSYGLYLRGTIAGRLPAANMFESLLFLSWGMGAFAIVAVLFTRNRAVPLNASIMGALSLFLADILPIDHFIRPIAPVLLDTFWMSVHVPVIMVSYSVLALAVLVAHVQVVAMSAMPQRPRLAEAIDLAHTWYMHIGAILLFIGIATGSMWAASSWGRYWGWDPKEVWSLIAFLGYMVIMHVRVDRESTSRWALATGAAAGIALILFSLWKLSPVTPVKALAMVTTLLAMVFFVIARGPLATAVKSVLAFWMIIMTYVGVNYILGIGLHSYGFGTGAIANWVFLIGSIDLAFVVLCGLVYLRRRTRVPGSGIHLQAS